MTTSDTILIADSANGVYAPKIFIEKLEGYLSKEYLSEHENDINTLKMGPHFDSDEYNEQDNAYFDAWNNVFETMEIIFEDKKYFPFVSEEGDIWLVLSTMLFNEETGWFEHPGET